MSEITGYIERITYQNGENGYTVAQLKEPKRADLVCIVGFLPSIKPGETLCCQGEWKNHLIHGRQFEVKEYRTVAPADLIGIKKYLGSGLIKGIGPKYAGRIVEKFGINTLEVIDKDPEQLLNIEGIGKKRVDQIQSCWQEQKSIRDVMIFLQSHGVSPAYAQKVYKTYGDQSIAKVSDNPFHLARDIYGIGFKTADTIAQTMGISIDSDKRIDAGIEFVLTELAEDGHVCYPTDEFLKEAQTILEVASELIESRLTHLKGADRIELFDLVFEGAPRPFIWKRSLFTCEVGIARELTRLKRSPCHLRPIDTTKAIAWVQELLKIELAPKQMNAVACSLTEKVQVITGGPGTGKSTITNAILNISNKLTAKIVLAAPTGRAAKRMTEITKTKAVTLHSLLEVDFSKGGFKRGRDNPLDLDLLIVDEASMIDTFLMYSLLKALPSHARLIFVGDINQLPSVGAGNVLKDIISSKTISTTMLNEIFRQAAGSRIIVNSHKINQGQFPELDTRSDSDFFFIEAGENEEVLKTIVGLVTQRIPRKYGFNAFTDIQVLAPMKRGNIGTENLNTVLQEMLNPKDNPLFRGGRRYHEGDKVMQLRNNYRKEVFNGDIGRIESIDFVDEQLTVNFDGRMIEYDFAELDELTLSYAVSVHKYQGSECPCVVIPVHTSHFKLLHRNLLYTAVTRGKKLVILVGTKKAIALAVHNDEVKRRYTGLRQALLEE